MTFLTSTACVECAVLFYRKRGAHKSIRCPSCASERQRMRKNARKNELYATDAAYREKMKARQRKGPKPHECVVCATTFSTVQRNAKYCGHECRLYVMREKNARRRGGRAHVGQGEIGREQTHCKHGHEFTNDNTHWAKDKRGRWSRTCRSCNRIRSITRYYERGGIKHMKLRRPLWERDNGICPICREYVPWGRSVTIDAWLPFAKGGRHDETNLLEWRCRRCNSWKGPRF